MKLLSKEIQNQYDGFLQTACLWNTTLFNGLKQFNIEQNYHLFNLEINPKIRLGKYIERFVSFQLQQISSIKILAENIQIQKNKITLGEIDCLLLNDLQPIHLEIIYKFYLYDNTVGNNEIEHFIGPNRKDSLIEKLIKLKEKQLPLLYSNECKDYLHTLNLKVSDIKQRVYFKAQLFVPFSEQNIKLKELNSNCIVGFYINIKELQEFINCKFYIPNKKDWLLNPKVNVNWIDFNVFLLKSNEYLERKFSPLCWIKKRNGEINKFFLVWWK